MTLTAAATTTLSARTATVTIGGRSLLVTQAAGTLTIGQGRWSAAAGGGSQAVTVTASPGTVQWVATSNEAWLTLSSGSGTGSGSVTMIAAATTTVSTRSATVTIGGQELAVNQEGGQADLDVSLLQAPASAAPGQKMVVRVTTRNRGLIRASALTSTGLYLSADTALDAGDLRLRVTPADTVPALGSSDASSQIVEALVPSSVAGAAYLLACADANSVLSEQDETNNCRSVSVSIQRPDLRVRSLANPPANLSQGVVFQANATVENIGGRAGNSRLVFYLSIDKVVDGSDRILGQQATPDLDSGGTTTAPWNVQIPIDLSGGTYWLIACADARGEIAESDEANNCLASTGFGSIGVPDITVSSVGNIVQEGRLFQFKGTLQNVGTGASRLTNVETYLSVDRSRSRDDVALSKNGVNAILPSSSVTMTKLLTAPKTLRGSYYIVMCFDPDEVLSEEVNKANNCRSSVTAVTFP